MGPQPAEDDLRGAGQVPAQIVDRAGAYGHVAWVQHVHTDGSASIVHYNGSGTRTFSVSRVKAPRYLYVGVRAPR